MGSERRDGVRRKRIGSISCRSVGPGGTTVTFYREGATVIGVWTNENCPYDYDCTHDDDYVASDGHNVSELDLGGLLKGYLATLSRHERDALLNPQPHPLPQSKKKRKLESEWISEKVFRSH